MKKTTNEIQALITLLGDDDTKVRDIAREHLLQIGQDAATYLRQAANADVDGKTRIEARHVLAKIRQEDVINSFYQLGLLDDEQIDLEHAVFLLARVGYPDLEVAPFQKELDELARSVRPRLADARHTNPAALWWRPSIIPCLWKRAFTATSTSIMIRTIPISIV